MCFSCRLSAHRGATGPNLRISAENRCPRGSQDYLGREEREKEMQKPLFRAPMLLALALGLAGATGACADVTVSSKIDTEGGVLGNIILEMLKTNEIPVVDKIQLGATPILREAIIQGQVDIYPDYTGNGAFFFNQADDPVWKDPEGAYQAVKKLDYDANKIVWLAPASANNTWAIALRRDLAEAKGLKSLSDFGAYVAAGGTVKLAASSEFVTSASALPAFQEAYGFTLSPDQLITLSGGDTAATIAAAAQKTSGADAAMVYGTDGGIAAADLVVLTDDKNVQPIYQPAPLVREAVLMEYPQIEGILTPVFAALDLKALQEMNGRVQVGGEPAAQVAHEFLLSKGFVH